MNQLVFEWDQVENGKCEWIDKKSWVVGLSCHLR